MHRLLRSGLKVALALAMLSGIASACGGPNAQCKAGAKAQLVVQADGAVRIGEVLHANLILPENSKLATGHLTRASCTSFQFKVEPATGWHDPWAEWYESGIPQHATGRDGPFSCGVPGAAIMILPNGKVVESSGPPPQISFTLNDWVQFDRPGKYKISVTYRTEYRDPKEWVEDPYDERRTTKWVTLTTDPIEVEVLPEAANAADLADDELAQLRQHYGDDDPVLGESDSFRLPEWAAYAQVEAVVPLLAQFFETSSYPARLGLIASPHQARAVAEMEKSLVDPRHSVSFFFMDVLAFDAARLRHPELFAKRRIDQWSPEWEEFARKRNQAYLAELAKYTRELLTSLPSKREEAQGGSLSGALLVLSRWNVPGRESLRKEAARSAAEIWPKTAFPNVSEEEWRVVASRSMLPFVRKNGQMRRWYELAPREAAWKMVEAARTGDWAKAFSWAGVIPEGTVKSQELDRALLLALPGTDLDDEQLEQMETVLVKFGGPDLVRPVQRLLDSQTCLGEPALWAFLLKRTGATAEKRLLGRYEQTKNEQDCFAGVSFLHVAEKAQGRQWSPSVESVVKAQLNEKDPVAIEAAELLQEFGSASAEDALWERLEQWHRSPPLQAGNVYGESDLETVLIRALLDGRNWLPEKSTIERLRKLCVSQCVYVKWERSVNQTQSLLIDDCGAPAGYGHLYRSKTFAELEAWLERFPAGTRFEIKLVPGMAPINSRGLNAEFPGLARFLRAHGFVVVDTLPYDEYGRCRQPIGNAEFRQVR